MRWEDERYVRVYTRDTAEWLALGWEGQALLLLLLRKADRAGILQTGKAGVRGVAALAGMPLEVVQRVLPALLDDGCLRTMDGGGYVFPNFLQAQEARSSDAQRKREQRARDREKALAGGASGSRSGLDAEVTMSRAAGQDAGHRSHHAVTSTPDNVTAVTESVTPSRTVPYRTEPGRAVPKTSSAAADAPTGGQVALLEIQGKEKPKPPRRQPDGEHHALWRALEAEYQRVMGHAYASGNAGADATAVKWLRETAKAPPEESVRRWGNLLTASKGGFPTVTGFKSLQQHWNTAEATGSKGGRRPGAYARAEDSLAAHERDEREGRVGVVDLSQYDLSAGGAR